MPACWGGKGYCSTGSHDKAGWMKPELQYDEVIFHGEGAFNERLQRYRPDGIDLFVDTVGGE